MHLLLQACFVLAVLQQCHAVVFSECLNDFMCYAITPHSDAASEVMLDRVKNEDLTRANIAIMMIHAYSQRHYRIVLKSLDNDVTSIEFKLQLNNEHIFSCSKEDENGSPRTVFKVKGKVKESTEFVSPLNCNVDLKSGSPIIADIETKYVMGVNYLAKPSVFAEQYVKFKTRTFYYCDPVHLKYKHDQLHKTRSYKKINLNLNDFYCDERYDTSEKFGQYNHLEFHKAGTSEYVPLNELKCELRGGRRKFTIDGLSIDEDSDIDIRCVGNATFFCDYDPKYMPGKEPMIRTKPNKTLGTPSKIECPSSHPFFVIKGRAPLSKEESKFECLNYKGEMMWTVKDDILTKTYPEVYCANEKDCGTVSNSFLHAGSFINEENLPACHQGGQLWINKESTDKCLSEDKKGKCTKIIKFICDKTLGVIKYYHDGPILDPFLYEDNYHIFCDYPKTAQQANKRRANTIIISATVSAVGTFIVTSVIMFFVLRRIHKRRLNEMDKLKKAYEAEAQILRNPNFDPSDIEAKSNKSKRDSVKSGKGTITTRSSIAEKDKSTAKDQLSVKKKGRGFFTEKNERPLVEIEAPKGLSREIKKAYEKNTQNRYRTDGLPKGYKKEYNEETRGVMQKTFKALHESTGYDNVRALITYGREQFMIRQKKQEEQMKKDLAQKKDREHKKKSKSKKK